MTKEKRIKQVLKQSAVLLLEACIKENLENPLLQLDIELGDGEKYILQFERVDANRSGTRNPIVVKTPPPPPERNQKF